jgi:hypothetical protein
LNKSAGENKNRRNAWGPQKNVTLGMEIDLNICHNFCIGHFAKIYFSLGLEFDENLN